MGWQYYIAFKNTIDLDLVYPNPWCSTCKNSINSSRAGVSRCGALWETLLRGPAQSCVQIFEGLQCIKS